MAISFGSMSNQQNIYAYVMACLRAKAVPQKRVAEGSGVPFSTVAKIAQGKVSDPSVHNVQKLADFFSCAGVDPKQGDGAPR